MSKDSAQAVSLSFFEGLNQGSIEHALSRFRDDATWLGLGPDGRRRTYSGRTEIVAYFTGIMTRWNFKVNYKVSKIAFASGVEMIEYTNTSDEMDYVNRGVLVSDIDAQGRISAARSYFDWQPVTEKALIR